jgi:hypothetical protein
MGTKNSKLIEANRTSPSKSPPKAKTLVSAGEFGEKSPETQSKCLESIPIPILAPLEIESIGPPPLSEEQCALLAETWRELESNIARVGVITFIRWVTTILSIMIYLLNTLHLEHYIPIKLSRCFLRLFINTAV